MQQDPKKAVIVDFFKRHAEIVMGKDVAGERMLTDLSERIDAVIGSELTPDERRRMIAVLIEALHDLTYVEDW